jgi:hypothetical protein
MQNRRRIDTILAIVFHDKKKHVYRFLLYSKEVINTYSYIYISSDSKKRRKKNRWYVAINILSVKRYFFTKEKRKNVYTNILLFVTRIIIGK